MEWSVYLSNFTTEAVKSHHEGHRNILKVILPGLLLGLLLGQEDRFDKTPGIGGPLLSPGDEELSDFDPDKFISGGKEEPTSNDFAFSKKYIDHRNYIDYKNFEKLKL